MAVERTIRVILIKEVCNTIREDMGSSDRQHLLYAAWVDLIPPEHKEAIVLAALAVSSAFEEDDDGEGEWMRKLAPELTLSNLTENCGKGCWSIVRALAAPLAPDEEYPRVRNDTYDDFYGEGRTRGAIPASRATRANQALLMELRHVLLSREARRPEVQVVLEVQNEHLLLERKCGKRPWDTISSPSYIETASILPRGTPLGVRRQVALHESHGPLCLWTFDSHPLILPPSAHPLLIEDAIFLRDAVVEAAHRITRLGADGDEATALLHGLTYFLSAHMNYLGYPSDKEQSESKVKHCIALWAENFIDFEIDNATRLRGHTWWNEHPGRWDINWWMSERYGYLDEYLEDESSSSEDSWEDIDSDEEFDEDGEDEEGREQQK